MTVYWLAEISPTQAHLVGGYRRATVSNVHAHLVALCQVYMRDHPIVFGGHNAVEVDEAYFSPKRKFNRGAYVRTGRWVVGMAERNTGKIVLVCVPNRTRDTLEKVIEAHIPLLPYPEKTDVVTDDYPSYNRLNWWYNHRSINHSNAEYVRSDPDGFRVHTNTIEGCWGRCKTKLRAFRGGRKSIEWHEAFFSDISWRSLGLDIFDLFCPGN